MNNPQTPLANNRVTTDVVILTVHEGQLKVLLLYRQKEPFANQLCLPGGFLWEGETSAQAGLRILKDKAGVDDVFFEQLYTFDAIGRDPRGSIISVAYFALVPASKLEDSLSSGLVTLQPVAQANNLAFDHSYMLNTALKRLRTKLVYSNVAYSLLPKLFTLTQLQDVYEVILGHQIDKRNFRKKILSLGLVAQTNQKLTGARNRPAQLFRFEQYGYTELDEPIF